MSEPIYDGDPARDSHQFRRCLGQFATGVTVVTARVGGTTVGMTANSFSSVSLDPPLILWSVDRKSSRFPAFQAATHFAVNVLAEDQIDLSRQFGRALPDQFAGVQWQAGNNGAPILPQAAAVFECTRAALHQAGDHVIVVGQVSRALLFERRVLLFSQGRYRIPADHPGDLIEAKSLQAGADMPASAIADSLLLSALFRANHRLSAEFSRFREGMTRDQHRVLIGVERHAGVTFDQLTRETYLGVQATEDAVAALVTDGSIVADAGGQYSLSEFGRARRHALVERLAEMERALLKDIPDAAIRAGRQLLQTLAGD